MNRLSGEKYPGYKLKPGEILKLYDTELQQNIRKYKLKMDN